MITDKEFSKEESKEAIKEIKKKWLKINDKQERMNYEMGDVIFTLPENEWPY
jgi:hypothetical protein